MPQKPPFDPNKPFEEVRDSKPAFDPNKAFEVVEDTPQQPVAPAVPGKPPAPSAPMVSPSTSVAGSSPAGSGAGQTKPKFVPRELPLDLIGASRITQEPDMASVAVDQTNTLMTPGEQEFRKEFAPMDLAAVKEFKKKIPQKMQLIQQQQAGLEADKKALEEARVQLESDLSQAQQQMAENPAIAPQLQAQHQADVDRYNQMVASANKQAESIKDLARSVEADYQKADLQEYNLKSQQGGFFGASHNKIVEGVLSMASVVPEISIDLIAGLTPESMLPSIGGEAGKSRDQLAKEWKRDIIPAFKEAGMNLWRSGTTEEYEAEMSKGILGRSWLGLMQSAPAMATPMMSGIFLQVYAGAKEEMRGEEWDGVPEGEKNAMAALLALPATALERMGFSNLAANNPFVKQLLARSLASLPKNATKEQIEAVINAETTDAVMNYVIRSAGATISEAETGGVQYITDVAIKDMFNRFLGEDGKFELPKSWGEYAQGAVMSAAEEGVGGFIMGQLPALAAARRAKKNVGEVTTDTQFELLEETLKNPEYLPMMQEQLNRQVESGKISKVQADDTISAWKESQQIVSKIPEDLPTEKRREAFDLLTQKAKLSKMDKALVGDKIAAIDAKLMKLAGVEPTAKEGDVKTEAPTPPQAPVPVSPEVRDEILRARQELGVDFDPLEDLPESVVITFGRVEDNIPVSAVDIEAASSWMYKKYKEVMSMRNDPNRLLTLDQIDSYAAQLGADIELLENHKQKLRDESEGVGAAQAANTKGATAPVSGTQATETKPQGRVAPTATQVAPQAISPEGQVVPPLMTLSEGPSIGIGGGQGFVPRLRELGYTDAEISKMNFEQQQDIVEKGTEPARAESTARVTPTAKGPVSPVDGEMTVKSFAESIASGNRLDTPEAVQFYENNKKEIEAELQRMAGPQKQAPQQAPVDPNDDAEVTLDEEVADDPDALLEEAMGTPLTDEEIDAEMANIAKSVGGTDTDVIDLDQDGYAKAVKDASGDTSNSMSEGFFIGKDRDGKRRIYINRDMFRRGLMAHEGTHAIIFAALSKDPKAKKIISNSAKQALGASPGAKKVLLKFLENYGGAKTKADGSVDVDATVADPELGEEVMSEFVASIYNGTIKLDSATRQFIRDLYNRIMAALGVSTKVEFKEDGDFIAAAKQIASAMKAGRKIKTASNMNPLADPDLAPGPIRYSNSITNSRKVKVSDKGHSLSFVKKSDIIDFAALVKDIADKKQNVWFWAADQLGRGMYADEISGNTHFLDAGPSYALDPKNRSKGIIWASGLAENTLRSSAEKADYIFIVSGSPQRSKLFNKAVIVALKDRVEAKSKLSWGEFAEKVMGMTEVANINKVLSKYPSFQQLLDSGADRKVLFNALIDQSNLKATKLSKYFKEIGLSLEVDSMRDGFYVDNDFGINDVMLVLKPSTAGGKSSHGTYGTNVYGEVVGVPDIVVNGVDLLPEDPSKTRSRVSPMGASSGSLKSQIPSGIKFSKRQPDGSLNGLPRKFKVGGKEMEASHWQPAEDVAISYMEKAGLPYNPPSDYVKVDPARAKRIADAYEAMKHDPENPEVKEAYEALAKETIAQYEEVLGSGLKVEFIPPGSPDPYAASPRLATEDIRNNNHMWVFGTRDGFGSSDFDPSSNPLLEESGFEISGQPALVNDLFRVVHDYFGHVKEGVGFRADGEENAWRMHSSMFSPKAQRALTTETRGQNSWVNFGPQGEKNRTASGSDTVYADQKTGLLPMWVSEDGRNDSIEEADKPKFSKATPGKNRVPQEHRDNLTDDGKGNYVFFHKGPKSLKGGKINPSYFGSGKSKDNRSNPVMNYYTKPDQGERMISGDVTYAVPVPKWKVYPLMSDPLDLYDKAEANFRKKFGKDQAFDAVRQADFIGPLAEKAGFDMMIAGWSVHPLRAESGKALKPDAKLTKKYEDEGVVDLTAPGAYERMMAKARGDVKFSKKTDQAFDGKKVPKTPIGDTKTVMVDGKERTVFNSNGKPIHPTVEGVENFWKWFGESKVVDKQGRPRVMYHGGTATTEFSREKIQIGGGFFFAPKKSYAALYAKRLGGAGVVTEAYLKADKLSESIENTREILKRAKDAGRTWIEQAKLDGFNGSVFLGGAEISVYEPNQIKSATGNYGSFDPSDPNIRFSSASPENIAKALIAKGYNTKAKAREYMVSKGADRMVDQVMAEFDKLRDAANARKASAQVTPTPPATPTPPPTTRQDGGGRPMRGSAKRMKEQYPELYAALGEDTIYYDRMPMTVTRDAASELVGWLGLERAKDEVLNRSSDIPDAVRAMMGRVVMKQLADEHRLAELDTFAENFFKLGTSAGQFINALRDVYEEFSKDMIFYRIQRIVEKEVEKRKGKDKNYKKLRDGLTKVNKEVAEEVIRTRKVRDKATDASFPKPDPSKKPKTTPAYGSTNKGVKKAQHDQAWRELNSILPSGVAIPQLVTIAAYHIEAGSRSFAAVAERVIAKGGRKLLPYLKGSYKQAAKDMGIEPSTDAEIDEYINKANTEKIVDKLRKAIKAKDKKSEAAAIAALQQVAKDDGLWGKYRKEAVSRLTRLADQDIKDDIQKDTIIAEFTAGLVRNITDQMKKEAEAKGLESKEPKTPKSAIEIIGDAYRNFDKYEQVWKDTQSEWKRRLNAAEARLAKATTPEAKQKAQADIVNEQSRLDRLDAYYGELMIKPFSEAAIGRAVKDGMKELDQKIDNIIRQHYTVYEAAKQTLADKLVQGAGLTEVEAAKLADAVKAEFERLATERKKALVEQYAKRKFGDKKPARPKAGIQEELILLSNTGAFSDKEFAEKYGEMRGWPRLTEADIAELNRLSDRIQTAKEGRPKLEATEDLLSFQENLSGVSKWEVAQSVWFANMLSGFETQEVNFLSNQINLAMEVGVAVSKSTVKGKPMDAVNIVRALGYGFARGWYEAGAVMSTGYSPIRGRVDIPPALERYKFPKYLGMYNGLKMVRRVMVAADVLGFEPLKELRAYQYAAMKARSVDPSPIDRQRALDILNRDDDTIAGAKQQAEDEYQADLKAIEERNLTAAEKRKAIAKAERDKKRRSFELVELARDPEVLQESARFAARATYNYTPEGVLGAVAKGVNMILRELPALRYVVPFVNIIANVTNEALNYYAPVGIARAIAGGSVADTIMGRANKGMTEDQKKMQREDLVSKAVIGLVLQAAVLVLSDPGDDDDPLIEITANGYNNYKQNSEMESKGLWKPYSFRFRGTDTWISYQYTPLLFAFGLVGHLRDATKYRKEKLDDSTMTKYAVAMQRNIGTITDASFLATTADALGWLNDTKEGGLDGLARSTAKTVKAMVVPYSALLNQIQQNMDSAFGVPKMDTRGSLTAELIKNTPVAYFVRDKFPIMVDALGDPIVPSSGALRRFATTSDPDPSLLQKLFISAPAPDRFWRLMVDKKYPLSAPNPKTVTVYDDEAEKERILTEDELFKFYQLRGSMIKMELNDRFDELSTLDNKEFAEEMMAIQSYATTEAKWEATEME